MFKLEVESQTAGGRKESAEAGAAAINERENGERAPPGGSAEAGAAATGGAR